MVTYGIYYLDGLGNVGIVSTENGVYRIFLQLTDKNQLVREMEAKTHQKIQEDSLRNRPYFEEIQSYWKGGRKEFDLPLDWSAVSSPFDKRVLRTLQKIPFGETISYQGLAEKAGYPKAARAVGGVMRRNPFPILIPCHRVLRKGGGLGGYTGGIDLKIRLLRIEGRI
ncbi:MAG: methylated-DNA--[protein]-cysteine S-methyltransferase [Calditrichaeota bacterium]|nr:methylated-DNA--[protein]-cysteine S-methyltransferase [Calditrichota bacterium]